MQLMNLYKGIVWDYDEDVTCMRIEMLFFYVVFGEIDACEIGSKN